MVIMKYRKTKQGLEYISLDDWRRESIRDPKFRAAYESKKAHYDLICAALDARIKKGVTQKELARRVGTTQSAIARFESGAVNPTLDFAARISAALGAKLEVRISR